LSKPGAGSAQDCAPSPGYYGGSGTNAAIECPAGEYCPGDGSVARCPFGTTSPKRTARKADCSILSGFYGSDPDHVAACPDNTVSPPGSTDASACVPKIGYYGPPGQPATICPADSYCPGDGTAKACPAGMNSPPGSTASSACFVAGKWLMKVYQAPGPISAMPDVLQLPLIGQAFIPSVSFQPAPGAGGFATAVPGTPDNYFAPPSRPSSS